MNRKNIIFLFIVALLPLGGCSFWGAETPSEPDTAPAVMDEENQEEQNGDPQDINLDQREDDDNREENDNQLPTPQNPDQPNDAPPPEIEQEDDQEFKIDEDENEEFADMPVMEGELEEVEPAETPILNIYEEKVVYEIIDSNADTTAIEEDCAEREGEFNSCGQGCAPSDDFCITACVPVCELGAEDETE
jgi:hypothetical protein